MRDYENILAWPEVDDLAVDTYEATQSFPREEIYSLTSQLHRPTCSVPANIAEGVSRNSKKNCFHFLFIARDSVAEADCFSHLALRPGHLNREIHFMIAAQAGEASSVLTGLICLVGKEVKSLSLVSSLQVEG